MDFKKMGVFAPFLSLDSTSMIKCLRALLSDYPSIKFDSITTDKKHHGFKVFFTEPEDSVILQRNMLSLDEESIWIYPLTTYLFMRNVDHKKTPLFEQDLCSAIEKNFGKVLRIIKTDTNNRSKNWCLEIDIPEFKSLEVFKGRFIGKNLLLPFRNEAVVLEFWCRQCKCSGHFQHECPVRDEEEDTEPNNMTTKRNNTAEHQNNFRQPASTISDQSSDRISGSKRATKNFSDLILKAAEKIGTEVASSFSKESTESNFLAEKEIKKETEELDLRINAKEEISSSRKKSEISENNSHSKHKKTYKNADIMNNYSEFLSGVDNEVEFIGYADNYFANKSPNASRSSVEAESRNFEEKSRSPEAKFTFPSFFSSDAVDGRSRESSLAALTSPRGAEVTTTLSERLQDCINQVCTRVSVLDRKKLDAFLIHVKKKSNPIRVALNYTANTKGLKNQLQDILDMYYNTPQTGTKEDIQFIKWLNGLVERYDGSIPKKRKRTGKTDDEPLLKK